MNPSVSIIIPIYNAGKYIAESLDSALSQTLENIEIICVDDCSTDNSMDVVRGVNDSRIRTIQMDKNSGAGPARNKGVENATGEFIAFLDPDDLFASRVCLEELYETAKSNGAKICGGNLLEFYDENSSSAIDWGKATFTKNGLMNYADYPYSIGYYRFIYDRQMIADNGFKFPDLRRYQDPVWFVQVMTHAKEFYALDMPVYLYRKNHQRVNFTPEKIDHVLTGMIQNLGIFKVRKLVAHFKQEEKEFKNFIYKMIYRYPKMDVFKMIRGHVKKSNHIDFKLNDLMQFLKIGFILLKSNFKFKNNTLKSEINVKNKLYLIIKSPSGGAWVTARETAEYWSGQGYDIEIVSFLNDEITGTNLQHRACMFEKTKGKKLPRFITILYSLWLMITWFLNTKPKNIMTVGLPVSVPFQFLRTLFFWTKTSQSILADTHITAHLNYKLKKNNSLTFRIMSFITHNKLIYKWMMKNVSQVICLSQAMADDLIHNYGLAKRKACVIPPFINTDFFNHPLPTTNPENSILYVGRLSGEKNIGDLLKAMQLVLKQNSNAKLTIIGDGDSEERDRLKKLSNNLNLNNNVTFAGRQMNVADYHAKASCQVLTSHYEGFPLALVEACANGVPMVSFDGPSGPRDAITNGENGFIAPQYDVQALADAIIKALDMDWNREYIRGSASQFKTEVVKEKYLKFIQDLFDTQRQLS